MTDQSIKTENYKEHPELDYSHCGQYKRNLEMFDNVGHILQPSTRQIYEYIKNSLVDKTRSHPQFEQGKFIWRPTVIDIGCGGGFGSNIMSQEAHFVWGIDVDETSIKWAETVFTRHKNDLYYTPELVFALIDFMTESRDIMQFDIVACVEVIEHIDKYEKLLEFIKKACKKGKNGYLTPEEDGTAVYISTPNRNSAKIKKDTPYSKRHVREWTPSELYAILTKHFKYVTLMTPTGELRDLNMTEADMLFKCQTPI